MINKSIDQITEQDLQALIDNSVLECKTIEYKESLPGNSDSDKKEFLADVSSFANTSGGDLIYGIVEDRSTGFPILKGLSIGNTDQEIARIDNIIRDGIEPRVLFAIEPINLANSKIAIVVRVPKSWASPHRVIYKGHNKFYSRGTNGKYEMDVAELRTAFNLSETIVERIRNFRLDRISKIYANETPVPLDNNPKIVLHLIPIISFNPAQNYEIDKIASQGKKTMPMYCTGCNFRYNLDGFLTYSADRDQLSHSYVQLFRNGIIEAVEGSLLEPYEKDILLIPSIVYEKELTHAINSYISILRDLDIEPPVFVFLALLGVKGYSMAVPFHLRRNSQTIDRDILLLPEIVVDNYDVSSESILKPCFDSIWNACG
ncbi:MAG: ATP-binding protein, partial [Chloroflexota bacterium]|nr:ATP-binding protein [Chloroflexota bacterium]